MARWTGLRRELSVQKYHKKREIYTDPEDRYERLRTWRRERRKFDLDQRVPSRVCPCCNNTFAASRRWVILDEADVAALKFVELSMPGEEGKGVGRARKAGAMCRSCATYYLWNLAESIKRRAAEYHRGKNQL